MCHRLRLAREVGMTSTIALDMEKVSKAQEIRERRKEGGRKGRKRERNEDPTDDIICV